MMVLEHDAEATDPSGFQARELPQSRHGMTATPNLAPVQGPPQLDRAILFPHLLIQLPQHREKPLSSQA